MVKIGDKIKTEHGEKGEVIDITKASDGRYFVFYNCKKKKTIGVILEGDVDFKVVNK